ncbi:unnamed protein product [Ectocarpus sp. 6 AP-2014]
MIDMRPVCVLACSREIVKFKRPRSTFFYDTNDNNMGASCSSSALRRYKNIKERMNQKTCLTFHAADGLLPSNDGNAPPIWLFGEDHSENESDTLPKGARSCATMTDLVQHAVSSCQSNAAEVIVIYENAVISDFLETRDPNNDDQFRDDLSHHSVLGVRKAMKQLGSHYTNIRPVFMDVFGRIRLLHAGIGDRPRTFSELIFLAYTELAEFWVTCGKYTRGEALQNALILAQDSSRLASDTMFKVSKSEFYGRATFEVHSGIFCASLAKVLVSSRQKRDFALQLADTQVIAALDANINKMLSGDVTLPDVVQLGVHRGQLTLTEAKQMMFESLTFDTLGLAGDAILNEFITSSVPNDTLIVMHAGYSHVNNQRKWLLAGKYATDFEHISDLALQDGHFIHTRAAP